ncbi:MAG: hypothetical protein P4L93_04605, partial [Coriobacteriia bacterium]|nr:hypothetical protein [Coriobacteriia bacterium]
RDGVDAPVAGPARLRQVEGHPRDRLRLVGELVTTYANRIGQSTVAQSVATADEGVRVDSYIQYNVEKKRLLDQKLNSIVFGTPSSASSTGTLVPAKEQWTYSYLSIDTGNKSVGGPYSISYDTTYTVAKQKNGTWLVASVKATPKGTVK